MDRIKLEGEKKDCKISLEKELDILSTSNHLISHPQMDVVINLKTGDIYFIEVKCHEIFDNHKEIRLKAKYKDTDFIKTQLSNSSKISELQKGKEKLIAINNQLLTAEDFGCNLKTYHFDFKQFLCHLMGILQYQKENKEEERKAVDKLKTYEVKILSFRYQLLLLSFTQYDSILKVSVSVF